MKKSAVIVGSAYPLRGGLAAYNERLARELQHQGYDVRIYTFSLQYPGFLFPGKTQFSDDPAPVDLDIRVTINSINPFSWIKTGREIKSFSPDIMIVKFWLPFMAPAFGTINRIVRRNKKTRIISILDNVIPHEHRPGDRSLTRYFIGSIDAFIAMSRSVLNDLSLFNTSKPKLYCPHPLYDNFGEPVPKEAAIRKLGFDPQYRYILFFGFIRDYKGLDLLLKAMADTRIRQMNIKAVIAGEFYTDAGPYNQIIEEYRLKDKLLLRTDFIPDNDVKLYFCAADLVVQPYKTATQSGVTQIAYHFNKPMIVTNTGGLPEMVPHGKAGYVVEPDEREIADAIVEFFATSRGNMMEQNIQEEKKKYSWSRLVQAIESLSTGVV